MAIAVCIFLPEPLLKQASDTSIRSATFKPERKSSIPEGGYVPTHKQRKSLFDGREILLLPHNGE
jgi:hypothetical protein